MDINLTGTIAANTTLLQSGYNGYIIAAVGVILGAAVTSGLTLLRDILKRKQDRNDERNKLIGQLKGLKGIVLQYYAFYFFSFIERQYLISRSVIQATHAIDYEHIFSFPESERNRVIMRVADEAMGESIEYMNAQKEVEEINKWKEKLAKSNKELFITIGMLQNYFVNKSFFDELDKANKQIEEAMDTYAKLEKSTINKFILINLEAQKDAGKIPKEAYEEESEIDATFEDKWAASQENARIKLLISHIRDLQDFYFFQNISDSLDAKSELQEERESASKNLNDKLDALITLYQSHIN